MPRILGNFVLPLCLLLCVLIPNGRFLICTGLMVIKGGGGGGVSPAGKESPDFGSLEVGIDVSLHNFAG